MTILLDSFLALDNPAIPYITSSFNFNKIGTILQFRQD